MNTGHIIVVGAGIFGVTAALSLRERGHAVSLIDPGPIPHPLAASTDISKVVRMEYGSDEAYMALMERAREGWLEWNEHWRAAPFYHETGVVMVCREPMSPGGFEYESWQLLCKRGHHPERLNAAAIAKRFPAWNAELYTDGFFHASGGYAESGNVVTALVHKAVADGVELLAGRSASALLERGGRVIGVSDSDNQKLEGDTVVVATGAWCRKLLPELADSISSTGHPVFHLKPRDPELFQQQHFPTFTADVANTGFYGFPANRDGIVKVANHGVGTNVEADAERVVSQEDHERLSAFLRGTFPSLVGAKIMYTRLCLYADTQDEDFWIAPHPERPGLVVSGGGSGHGFKFAPVLGKLTADAVEGLSNPLLDRFRWRADLRLEKGHEAARCHIRDDH